MQSGEDLSESFVENDLGVAVLRGLITVHDDQMFSPEIMSKCIGRIDRKGSASDDEHIGFGQRIDRVLPGLMRQALFVERDIRTEHTTALAVRDRFFGRKEDIGRMLFSALVAVHSLSRAVHFIDFPASGFLMEPVDVLCDHAGKLPCFFHLGELDMSDIRFDLPAVHFLSVVFEEDFRLIVEAAVAQKILRRVLVELYVVLVIKSVFASEIRNAALCGHTCATEKDNGCSGVY